MQEESELEKHKRKWKMWNEGFAKQDLKDKIKVQQNMESYAVNLIQKIKDSSNNNDRRMNKDIGHEIESNVCGICLDLMVPPANQPIIVIPCGHNVCRSCIYTERPSGYKGKQTLRLNKCPICRTPIESHALNRTLMTLICTYTNNKELLEKEMQREQEEASDNMEIEKLRIRCDILSRQKKTLAKDLSGYKKEKQILSEVVAALKKEKKRNSEEMETLQEQARLINSHLSSKLEDLALVENRITDVSDKEKMVDRTLRPLLQEKEKLQILEVAKMVQENNPSF